MDEMARQLLGEVREPLAAAPRSAERPGRPRRYDHHYERNGTVSLFTFFEPLAAWRTVLVRDRRTKLD